MQDIEEGNAVSIPRDLSQNGLPLSYRYYDPIYLNTVELMKEDKSDLFKLRNSLGQQIYSEINQKYKFLEKMGLKGTLNKEYQKLTFKYSIINKKERNNINVADSVHTMGVQRSNYLQIDTKLMADLHHNPHKVKAMAAKLKRTAIDKSGRVIDEYE